MRSIVLALASTLIASAAAAQSSIAIPLPDARRVERIKVDYACDGGLKVRAEYFNAPPLALATIAFADQFVILANVLSGSGAKYAGGPYIWWTKGPQADLYDLTRGEDAPPVACKAVP